jgi:hypothetical protein
LFSEIDTQSSFHFIPLIFACLRRHNLHKFDIQPCKFEYTYVYLKLPYSRPVYLRDKRFKVCRRRRRRRHRRPSVPIEFPRMFIITSQLFNLYRIVHTLPYISFLLISLGGIVNNNISTFCQYFVMILTYIMNRDVPLSMYVGIVGLRRIKISLLIRSPWSATPLFLMFIPYVHHDGVKVLNYSFRTNTILVHNRDVAKPLSACSNLREQISNIRFDKILIFDIRG